MDNQINIPFLLDDELDEIAEGLFAVRTSDQVELGRLLIRAREKSIFPMLNGMLLAITRIQLMEAEAAPRMAAIRNASKEAKYLSARLSLNSEMEIANSIIRRIGHPAQEELCKGLRHENPKIRILAALVLSFQTQQSPDIQEAIEKIIQAPGTSTRITVLLRLALAESGHLTSQQILEELSRKVNLPIEELKDQIRNDVYFELRYGDSNK